MMHFYRTVCSSMVALGLMAMAVPAHAKCTATASQSAALRTLFLHDPNPSNANVREIGRAIGLQSRQVKYWLKFVRENLWQQTAAADDAAVINGFQDTINMDADIEVDEEGKEVKS